MMGRFLDSMFAPLRESPGVPPRCARCEAWHPPDERCGTLRHALDVLDPERVEAPVDERVTCPVCVDRLLRRPDDDICPTCSHRFLARYVLGPSYVPEGTDA